MEVLKIDNEIKNQVNDLLLGGMAACKPAASELEQLLAKAKNEKKKLRVKLGVDPTNPDLHLGHTVCLHALRKFQQFGHTPVLILGGFTATVGDPSGRNEARPPLTYKEVENNSKTYMEQVGKILDLKQIEVYSNYEWFSKFTLSKLLELAHIVTVNQLIAKEAFGTRIDDGKPLYMHEIMYPLLQGYDSVQIKADIELGGIDQTYNVLFGRHVQKYFNQKEQLAIFYPLLIGLDGSKKMSKSFNNYIALNDSPEEIYGKVMSLPDELIMHYFNLVTSFSLTEIASLQEQLERYKNSAATSTDKTAKDLKMELARNLVSVLHGNDKALKAEQGFISQFQENKIPEVMDEYPIKDSVKITDLMFLAKLVASKTEAKKLIQGGGVKLKSEKISDPNFVVTVDFKGSVLQIGKRKFIRII